MSTFNKSFFIGIAALGATTSLTLTAFSAPMRDADVPVVKPKPSKKTMTTKKPTLRSAMVKVGRAKRAMPAGLKGVVIDEPNLQTGTVAIVTESNEFATIATGMGTKVARGYQLAGLANIHTGYTIRCLGAWDQDGYEYQATSIALGSTMKETSVIARVNAACAAIGKARKGGGFGKSVVALLPPTALPPAQSIGGRAFTKPSPEPVVEPVPASLVPSQSPAPLSPSDSQPQKPTGTPMPAQAPVIPVAPPQ